MTSKTSTTAESAPRSLLEQLAEHATRTAKDAVYVSVGMGVLAFQQAQVRRHELVKTLKLDSDVVARGREQVAKLTKAVDEQIGVVEHRVDEVLDQVQARLPDAAGAAVGQVRHAAKAARAQIVELVS